MGIKGSVLDEGGEEDTVTNPGSPLLAKTDLVTSRASST
jgi:hypothetical protein